MFRRTRWFRRRSTRSTGRAGWTATKVLGLLFLTVWVAGVAPLYVLTPVGDAAATVLGWKRSTGPSTPVEQPSRPVVTTPAAGVGRVVPTGTPVSPTSPTDNKRTDSVVDTSGTRLTLPVETKSSEERFAFLLMGYGGGGHEGGYLTDSMMVVIVDPNEKSLAMVSIPRDSWVPMSLDGKTTFYNKINTAYALGKDASQYPNRNSRYKGDQGAGRFAADTVSRILDVPVPYYLALDFVGFRQMIDAVGGVDVDVPRAFAAQYPANDDPSIDASWTVVRFRAGEQRMDGERAIQYARARTVIEGTGEAGDFARSRRQRLVMEAFQAQLLQPAGIVRVPRLVSIAATHVDTNYDVPAAAKLGELLLDWSDVRIHQTALTPANYLEEATGPDGAYVLVPNMADHSWTQVRAFGRRLWNTPRSGVAVAQTPLSVVNATGQDGLAGHISGVLTRLGYLVGPPATGTPRGESRLLDGTDGQAGPLARELMKDLGTTFTEGNSTVDGLVLEIGRADMELIDLKIPADPDAPRSVAGITHFGSWQPEPDEQEPVRAEPTRRPAGAQPRASATSIVNESSRTPSPQPTIADTITPTREQPATRPSGSPTVDAPPVEAAVSPTALEMTPRARTPVASPAVSSPTAATPTPRAPVERTPTTAPPAETKAATPVEREPTTAPAAPTAPSKPPRFAPEPTVTPARLSASAPSPGGAPAAPSPQPATPAPAD